MVKILFEHANSFEYNEENLIHNHSYNNCLIARICFENKDESKIEDIAKVIQNIFIMLRPNSLIVFPFCHLSSYPLRKKKAEILFNRLKIELYNIPLIILPFGINKGYKINIKNHRFNNIFRSI